MKHVVAFLCVVIFYNKSVAQDSTSNTTNPVTFSGYVEGYYSYDFDKPSNNTKPSFIYSHNRSNEFNINLAYVKASYNEDRVRANFAVAAGTYMNANYAAEPGVLKNIYEADAGYKLSKKSNLWFDIGIMPSHIGFETAVSKDDWTLTRSIAADNSPYFESGAKLTYTTNNNKLTLTALALNGWQRITRVDGNSLISWGTEIFYKPNDNIILNYSTFFGSDKPDSARQWRIFHDVYGIFQLNKLIGLTLGFDIGQEQKSKHSSSYNTWYTPQIVLRFTPTDKFAFALREEYYSDAHGVIIYTATQNGFKTFGTSLNFDYLPAKNIAIRIEGKLYHSKDDIFMKVDRTSNNNSSITFSTAVAF